MKNPVNGVPLPRKCDHTQEFLKDWIKLSRNKRYNMQALKEAMLLLVANNAPLPAQYRDHALKGNWKNYRECHIGGDFLLIYRLETSPKGDLLIWTRAGTHADLFE